ncbi:MAG: hypothetical protein ACFE9I_11705 [Candidatus Hermodarchaeota archaeon]
MSDYDYNFKVLVTGNDPTGKAYISTKFSKSYFNTNYKYTIGIDFHVKTLRVLGSTVNMQLWEVVSRGRFKSLLPMYYRGALGALIISDMSKVDFQNDLDDIIRTIRESSGDIPIIFIAFKHHSEEIEAILGVETMLTADNFNRSLLSEISLKPDLNLDTIFNKLAEYLIERSNISPPPRLLKFPIKTRNEFIINQYLKLRLEFGTTNIYVGGKLFKQCKYLLLDIPVANIAEYNEIESIDEAAEKLDRSMERGQLRKYDLSPDIEFWGHCSNLQVWYENEYDSRLLHRNLAFPLLRALVEVGDPLAKKVFKEEIALRIANGYPSVVKHLINEDYLKYLNSEELDSLLEDRSFIKNLPKWFNQFRSMPKWLSKKIKVKLNDMKCPHCNSKISYALIKKFLKGNPMICEFCHKNILNDIQKFK